MKTEKDRLQSIIDDRAKIYGDVVLSHQAIGLAWEAVLRNRYHNLAQFLNEEKDAFPEGLIPADVAMELLAAFKLIRYARPVFKQDSIDDCRNFLTFSERRRQP